MTLIEQVQKNARESKELGYKLSEFDPNNEVSGEVIDVIIAWSISDFIGHMQDLVLNAIDEKIGEIDKEISEIDGE